MNSNQQWILASLKASRPLNWYDLIGAAILAVGGALAVLGWLVFDGSRLF